MAITPGPLTITGPSDRRLPYDYGGDYVIRAKDGRIIAETFHLTGEDKTEDAQANAQLFATASKLLEACEAVETLFDAADEFPDPDAEDYPHIAMIGVEMTARHLVSIALAKVKGD